jgi:hypothetical protein
MSSYLSAFGADMQQASRACRSDADDPDSELQQRSGLLTQHRQHLNEVCAKVLFQIARPSQYNAFSEPGRLRHAVRDVQL